MSTYDTPANDAPVVLLADLPVDFVKRGDSYVVLQVETVGGGVLAVETQNGKQRVWTVAAGEKIPVLVAKILDVTTEDVDGYPSGTATDVAKIRAYSWT